MACNSSRVFPVLHFRSRSAYLYTVKSLLLVLGFFQSSPGASETYIKVKTLLMHFFERAYEATIANDALRRV